MKRKFHAFAGGYSFWLVERLFRALGRVQQQSAATTQLPAFLADDPVLPRILYPGAEVKGRYVVEAEIGRGGVATIYRVHDSQNGEKRALKCLHAELAGQPLYDAMLRREAALQRRCIHPHILALEDVVEAPDGRLALVFPLLQGGTLAERMARNNGLNPRRGKLLRALLLSALEAMVAQNIAHLDISPENIMFADESYRSVKLIDFSLARDCSQPDTNEFYRQMFAGKEKWAAPEIMQGGSVTPACDRYSLDLLLRISINGWRALSHYNRRVHLQYPAPRTTH
jgi:eukaryotic-like serine/threonine-protein kinase